MTYHVYGGNLIPTLGTLSSLMRPRYVALLSLIASRYSFSIPSSYAGGGFPSMFGQLRFTSIASLRSSSISAAFAMSAYDMAISSGVPVTLRIKGFLSSVDVPRWRCPTTSLIRPRYSLRVCGLYPYVFSELVFAASGMNFSVALASDFGAEGWTLLRPAGKKMCWWMVSSWLKPSRREVRVVTAPV